MIYSLHIQARSNPAMLEKILQTSRVRGFTIRSMDVKNSDAEQLLKIHLTVESNRPQERLVTQLNKLPGIEQLTALHAVTDTAPLPQTRAHSVSLMYPM
ncbi:MAG: acetolactate synthase 2 small subunit [Sedimenticola sp.]|uniref:Acetolactate synthase 2 small subunit n=1 Tax=Sedimenticola thiotaurini TaxID=1543721 RepID=A0A558D452_9GAMM|nr:acetolactate synthase 2 small subunit [Sedimenticola sp.]MCW8974117.1 acetolactate synthase 2 small subunit [Sedimenticola sp.]TVT55795.1 MAG: acetolactate synthase 2 small subunit [Sedimenticola thiotaurini]